MPKLILIIALICSAFSFCMKLLAESWACRSFSKIVLQDTICNYKEVSDAILAAPVIHDNRNCGHQFCCGPYLA